MNDFTQLLSKMVNMGPNLESNPMSLACFFNSLVVRKDDSNGDNSTNSLAKFQSFFLSNPNLMPPFKENPQFSNLEKSLDVSSYREASSKALLGISESENSCESILKINVTGSSGYDFTECYVFDLFSQFGRILKVVKKSERTAYVTFSDRSEALLAQQALNNYYFEDIDVKMHVNWCSNIEEDNTVEQDNKQNGLRELKNFNANSHNGTSHSKHLAKTNKTNFKVVSDVSISQGIQPSTFFPDKFTCTYIIEAGNDDEFKISRKIIGHGGCNMKKILETCQRRAGFTQPVPSKYFLKLRLRGRGSGFREGPKNKEADEPLQLCISSKYHEAYSLACELVEELINHIYGEYIQFCENIGYKPQLPLEIKKKEWCITSNTKGKGERDSPVNNKKRNEKGSKKGSNNIIIKKEDMRETDFLNSKQSFGSGNNNIRIKVEEDFHPLSRAFEEAKDELYNQKAKRVKK